MHNAHLRTFNGLPLGQDGDCSLCHLLLLHNRRDLWAPAVRTHPDEMTRLVGLFCCMEQPPAKVRKQMLSWIRSASQPAPLWFWFAISNKVVWLTKNNMTAFTGTCFVYCSQGFLLFREKLHYLAVALPDIVFVCKKDDDSCIWIFSQSPDDLVKLSLFWFSWNLDWLWEAHTTWIKTF